MTVTDACSFEISAEEKKVEEEEDKRRAPAQAAVRRLAAAEAAPCGADRRHCLHFRPNWAHEGRQRDAEGGCRSHPYYYIITDSNGQNL